MRSRDRDKLRSQVLQDWAPGDVAPAMLEALLQLQVQSTERLTLPFLRRISRLPSSRVARRAAEHIASSRLPSLKVTRVAAEYLASSRMRLIRACYAIIVSDDVERQISPRDFYRAVLTNVLYDPETGEPVVDWEDHVHMYYVATARLLRALESE